MPAVRLRGGMGQGQRLPGVCRAETWVDYLERAQGFDTEAVSLGYLLGRIGHHKAHEAGLTAGADRRMPRHPLLRLWVGVVCAFAGSSTRAALNSRHLVVNRDMELEMNDGLRNATGAPHKVGQNTRIQAIRMAQGTTTRSGRHGAMAGHCRGFAAADGCAQCGVSRVIAVTAQSWGVAS